MKNTKPPAISKVSMLAILLFAALLGLPAQASESCHLINAKAVGKDLGFGNTAADILGGGLLQGTVAGHITVTGDPISGLAPFMETATFTNQHGTLTVVVTGAIDINTGQFNATGAVTGATGKLSGATGNISFSGMVNFATAIFSEDVSGIVCVNLAP